MILTRSANTSPVSNISRKGAFVLSEKRLLTCSNRPSDCGAPAALRHYVTTVENGDSADAAWLRYLWACHQDALENLEAA